MPKLHILFRNYIIYEFLSLGPFLTLCFDEEKEKEFENYSSEINKLEKDKEGFVKKTIENIFEKYQLKNNWEKVKKNFTFSQYIHYYQRSPRARFAWNSFTISSCTCFGTVAYLANSILNSPFPCVTERMSVEYPNISDNGTSDSIVT